MNIIFAVQNNDGWDSIISLKYGRAKGFFCYSQETDELTYYSNEENQNAGHGAGINAAQIAINQKASVVITGGSMGPKAFEVLNKANIKMFTQAGEVSVLVAYSNFKDNKYNQVLASDK
ncbi:MAG: hypothetical protein JXA53_09765 [Bacteroidales bacterium]|nr:hypothetical protein [Bacteroidales bacterium]